MKPTHLTAAIAALVLAVPAAAGLSGAPDDTLARIRQAGMDRSKVQALFATLTDEIGPRLTGSPAHKRAAEWARDRLREFGLSDPKLEPFAFGRGWVLDRVVVEMVEPRYMPLIGYADAWSPPTKGDVVATPILLDGKSAADVTAMKDKLAGAIVMTQPEALFIRRIGRSRASRIPRCASERRRRSARARTIPTRGRSPTPSAPPGPA